MDFITPKNMKRVLVTGGAGFIGSNFIHIALNKFNNISIVNFDALTYAGNLDNLTDIESDSRYAFIHGDIRNTNDLQDVFSTRDFDTIVHFAAESHVDRSIENPSEFILTNVLGTANLLDVSLKYWNKLEAEEKKLFCFLHISTDEVFGSLELNDPPFTETTPYAPNSPYAASKAAADHLVRAYYKTYQFPAIISNCSNNYGPYQYPEKLIPLMISNAIDGKPLPIYGEGNQIRDWLYVEDHCSALLEILGKGIPGQSYNIGGNTQPTNLEITRRICGILDQLIPAPLKRPHQQLITFVKDRPGHDKRYAMDNSKMKHEIGWEPEFTLDEGLKLTIQWYLDHMQWAENIKNRPSYGKWIKQNYSGRGEIQK